MEPEHRRAAESHILSERTAKYRRTVLAISLVLTSMYFLADQIDASGMSFFGVKFTDGLTGQAVLNWLLWLALGYNSILFLKNAWYEFRVWSMDACFRKGAKVGFEHSFMFFGELHKWLPSMLGRLLEPSIRKHNDEDLNWQFTRLTDNGRSIWTAATSAHPKNIILEQHLDRIPFTLVRSKLRDFWSIEIGIPIFALVLAIALATVSCLG